MGWSSTPGTSHSHDHRCDESGKYVATEVGPASSVDDGELVTYPRRARALHASQNTAISATTAVLNMVDRDCLASYPCSCGYGHDLRAHSTRKRNGTSQRKSYRSRHNQFRNGDLYPTHGMGPIAQCLNIHVEIAFSISHPQLLSRVA